MNFYVETLSDGYMLVYNKDTNELVHKTKNASFLTAWIAIQIDYERKIDVIERAMLCLHGIEVDGKVLDIPENKLEFDLWIKKIRKMSMESYYIEVDKAYERVNKILKSYYKVGLERGH